MKSKILEIAKEKHISSKGSCGTYFSEMVRLLKTTRAEFEATILEMYNNDEIEIREGINGFMVMQKTKR